MIISDNFTAKEALNLSILADENKESILYFNKIINIIRDKASQGMSFVHINLLDIPEKYRKYIRRKLILLDYNLENITGYEEINGKEKTFITLEISWGR